MAASNINTFPLSIVVDLFISYIKWCFANSQIIPEEYRYSSTERKSKIYISGPFSVTRQKAGAVPTMTVSRSGFSYRQVSIDDLISASANSFDNVLSGGLVIGQISIAVEAGSDAEVSQRQLKPKGDCRPTYCSIERVERPNLV